MSNSVAYREMFRMSLLIRRVEEAIIDLYPSDKIQSPVHLSIGQEAVSAGLCRALAPGDLLFGTYRSHALYIACGGNLTQMFAELMGRVGGISKGKAGSMHLAYPAGGLMGSSAVVATHLPHAVGSALAARLRRTDQVVACVFGDGSLEEGVAHESFNFAALKALPILFLCENNALAIHSLIGNRQAFSIEGMARLYGFPYQRIEAGYDFEEVHRITADVVGALRRGAGPHFLEVITYRAKEHVGIGEDFGVGYRDRADYDAWCARDPLIQDRDTYAALIDEIDAEIAEAIAAAEASPPPGADDLLTDIL